MLPAPLPASRVVAAGAWLLALAPAAAALAPALAPVWAPAWAPAFAPAQEVAAPAPAVDDDPFLWLEDVTGAEPLAWVRERNARSTTELEGPGFEAMRARLLAILDSDEQIPFVNEIGGLYYNLWRDAKNPRGLWRRTTPEEYAQDEPAWETVLDLDALGAAEGENWVWHGADVLEPEGRLCLVSLSRGGADADVVREFDLERKAFVEGGFVLPESKNRVSWRDEDHLWVGTDTGEGSLTASGYPRTSRLWRRGQPFAEAETVAEGRPDDVSLSVRHDPTPGFERDLRYRAITFYTNEVALRTDDGWDVLEKPEDARVDLHRQWLLLELRSDWEVGGRTYAAGSLLATDLAAYRRGGRDLDVLFAPSERVSLQSFAATRHHVVLTLLDNVTSRLEVLTHGTGGWSRRPLEGLPEFGTLRARAVDAYETDELFVTASGFTTPTTLYLADAAGGAPVLLKAQPAYFDADGLVVSQHETESADGTRVPYFEVRREDLPLDGGTPTLLYAYGGFEIAMLPGYDPLKGAAWLERGGVYVLANIRGGGEFGPAWHQAALKQHRPRAYEDLAAVARDLFERKVTSPEHLGVMGGSNGGLLVGNMITGYPELFGAAVCQVPLLDMRRYTRLLAGASWMGEYGDPDDPAQWEFIRTFSPYHRVDPDAATPRTLFTTSTRDDRVHPGHARKMVARMEQAGKDVLYYENIEGGHGGAADNAQKAFLNALSYTFLWQELQDAEP